MKRAVGLIFGLFFISFALNSQANTISRLEFRDRPIVDILLALGEAGNLSIVPDATVSGNASYYFADMDFSAALRKFAASFNLYYYVRDGIYYVSRVDARFDETTGLASLHAEDVRLPLIVRAFSKCLGKTILHDELPDRAISIHAEGQPPASVLGILAKSFPELSLESTDSFFYLHRIEAAKIQQAGAAKPQVLKKEGAKYSLDADRTSFQDIIGDLFNYEGKDYSLLVKNDVVLDGLRFRDRTFEETLALVLEQANADYAVLGSTYYVFEIQRKDVLKKLKATIAIPVEHLSVSDIPALLPPDFASSGMLRFDKATNTAYVSGSIEEIKPIQDFIAQIDIPLQGRSYVRFDLRQLKAKDIIPVLPSRFSSLSPILLPDGSGFVLLVSDATAADLRAYIDLIDRKAVSSPITLRFIKTDDLIKNLPPSATKENVIDGGNGSVIFFVGSEEKRRAFLEELSIIDRPKAQIRYDILIVQYDIKDNVSITPSFNVSKSTDDSLSPLTIIAGLSNLLKLNFNIISELGYLFAVNLNSGLENNRAQIFADTTLFGTVGKDVKFQNTTTIRYLELEIDPDTGKNKSTGATREVSSGIILVLNSWASGDGMITTDISATVSEKLAGDSSSMTSGMSSPPTTSERIVSTNVHTPSGVPIVIGGLRQRKTEATVSKVPLLGDIPLFGKVFQQRADKLSDTEIVIYLVPYLTLEGVADGTQSFRLEHLYSEFVKDY
jgi:type II secretory pathway component GspD/PulD (secretin)